MRCIKMTAEEQVFLEATIKARKKELQEVRDLPITSEREKRWFDSSIDVCDSIIRKLGEIEC